MATKTKQWADGSSVTIQYGGQGDLASVEVEFETDTVVKKIGRGYSVSTGEDFNDDFSDDYLITINN